MTAASTAASATPPDEGADLGGQRRQVPIAAQPCIQAVSRRRENTDQTGQHRHHRGDDARQQEGGRDVAFGLGRRRVVGVDRRRRCVNRGREEHPEHRQPAGADESPPSHLAPGGVGQMFADCRGHHAPSAELSDAHDTDRRQPEQHHRAVDQVGDRRAPQPAERHVGGEDDRRHHHPAEHRQRGQRAQDDADDVGLDQVDDHVLGLHAETGEPLAPPVTESNREQLTDRVQPEAPEEDAEEQPHQRERQERVDAIPPQVPDPAADDVTATP